MAGGPHSEGKSKTEAEPKKPKTGYTFFCERHRSEVEGKSFTERSQVLSAMWKEVDEKEKKVRFHPAGWMLKNMDMLSMEKKSNLTT